jgi:hypothetical protein
MSDVDNETGDADEIEISLDAQFSKTRNVVATQRVFARSAAPLVRNEIDDASTLTSELSEIVKKRKAPSAIPLPSVGRRGQAPIALRRAALLPPPISYGKPNGSLPQSTRRRRPPPPRLTQAQLDAVLNAVASGVPMYGNPIAPMPQPARRRPATVLPAARPPRFEVSALLDRREAEPFRELTSMADCEPLEPLPGIEDVMVALDLDDQLDDDLFVPECDVDDSSEDDEIEFVDRLPHTGMFTAQALKSLLPLVTAKKIDNDEAVKRAAAIYVGGFVRPELAALAAPTKMKLAPDELSAVVPGEWMSGGSLLVGKSSARGQCLFSSVGILLFGGGADRAALRLRALCIFELVERWAQYVDWFDDLTVRDMLASLVGAPDDEDRKFGFAWPTAEVLLVLANVLQRRIVIVKRYSDRLIERGYPTDPHVVLPLLAVEIDVVTEPLVIVFDGDHYKPLLCSDGGWSIDFSRVAVEFETASQGLVGAYERLRQRGYCGEIRIRTALEAE